MHKPCTLAQAPVIPNNVQPSTQACKDLECSRRKPRNSCPVTSASSAAYTICCWLRAFCSQSDIVTCTEFLRIIMLPSTCLAKRTPAAWPQLPAVG